MEYCPTNLREGVFINDKNNNKMLSNYFSDVSNKIMFLFFQWKHCISIPWIIQITSVEQTLSLGVIECQHLTIIKDVDNSTDTLISCVNKGVKTFYICE